MTAPYFEVERSFAATCTQQAVHVLSEGQRDRFRQYWLDRAEGELTTALSFEYMRDDLVALNAPIHLVRFAENAIAEEHRHVDWCLRWGRLLGEEGSPLPTLSGTRPAVFEGASDHDNRVLRTIFGGCFSETVAVSVLIASHRVSTLDSARRLTHEHIKEELRHARLGWALLAWPGLSARDREMIGAYVGQMTRIVRQLWQSTRRASDPLLEGMGFLSSSIVDRACGEAIDDVVLPGLAHHRVPLRAL